MFKKSSLIKKLSIWSLYFFAIIISLFSINYLQEQNIVYALSCIFIALVSYTFLIIKSKSLSGISYITIILFSLCVMISFSVNTNNGQFLNAESERIFYLVFGPLALFMLILFAHLIKTQQNWKKKVSFILLIPTILGLLLLGTALPNFHNNFAYTRILIGAIFIFSIILIKKRKKRLFLAGGITGIIVSIMALLLSSTLFIAETYNIEKTEREAVLSFINPKVENMFQSYNQKDYNNFCNDCGEELKFMFAQDIQNFISLREQNGRYISYKDPRTTFTSGFYYVEYPIIFENIEDPIYFTFVLTDIKPEDTIYGFSFSIDQKQENE